MDAMDYLQILITQQNEKIASLNNQLVSAREKEIALRTALHEAKRDKERFERHRDAVLNGNEIPPLG